MQQASDIDQAEMQRLMNIGARAAIFRLIYGYNWPEGCVKILSEELVKYKEVDHGLV